MFNILEFEGFKNILLEKINSRGEKNDNFSHADVSVVSRRFLENSTAVSRSGSLNEISGMQGH